MQGYPKSRSLNLQSTAAEAKKVLLQTKSWERTKEHMQYWIRAKWGLSRMTVNDYVDNAAAMLMKDPETREYLA